MSTKPTSPEDADPGSPGSTFESFLEEEGRLDEATRLAVKRVIAFQLREAMGAAGLSKTAMAARMGTSRPQLDRLLDDSSENVTLATLDRAARAVGRRLRVELI